MKTVTFKLFCETGFVGATHEDEREVEFEDGATDQEIEDYLEAETKEWALEKIEYWFKIQKDA